LVLYEKILIDLENFGRISFYPLFTPPRCFDYSVYF
jgi:hypothetical protein